MLRKIKKFLIQVYKWFKAPVKINPLPTVPQESPTLDLIITDISISPDKKARPTNHKWGGIVIHHTDTGGRDLSKFSESFVRQLHKNIVGWLTKKDNVYVSAHYQIGCYGEVTMMVNPETHIAYHAGKSSWYNPVTNRVEEGCNGFMIGIELLGDGNIAPFSDLQYEKLIQLSNALIKLYPTIDYNCVVGHEHISPGRKVDPGRFFEWDRYKSKLIF